MFFKISLIVLEFRRGASLKGYGELAIRSSAIIKRTLILPQQPSQSKCLPQPETYIRGDTIPRTGLQYSSRRRRLSRSPVHSTAWEHYNRGLEMKKDRRGNRIRTAFSH